MEQIVIDLRRARDDPPAHDPQFQAELRAFADALRDSGNLADARTILVQLVSEFGRRRSPERAPLHLRLAELARAAADGSLVIPIAARLPFAQIREAHSRAEAGAEGKVVVRMYREERRS